MNFDLKSVHSKIPVLSNGTPNESKGRLSDTDKAVKRKFNGLAKTGTFGSRIIEAFGTDDKAFIAEKLGFATVQGVYKVLNGQRELDYEKLIRFRDYTKRSIDWLLTGESNESHSEVKKEGITLAHLSLSIEELTELIKNVVKSELNKPQELGSVDELLARSIGENNDAFLALQDWYRHDGLEPPEVSRLAFAGWEKLSLEDKIKQIRGVRAVIENQEYFYDEVLPSTNTKAP